MWLAGWKRSARKKALAAIPERGPGGATSARECLHLLRRLPSRAKGAGFGGHSRRCSWVRITFQAPNQTARGHPALKDGVCFEPHAPVFRNSELLANLGFHIVFNLRIFFDWPFEKDGAGSCPHTCQISRGILVRLLAPQSVVRKVSSIPITPLSGKIILGSMAMVMLQCSS